MAYGGVEAGCLITEQIPQDGIVLHNYADGFIRAVGRPMRAGYNKETIVLS